MTPARATVQKSAETLVIRASDFFCCALAGAPHNERVAAPMRAAWIRRRMNPPNLCFYVRHSWQRRLDAKSVYCVVDRWFPCRRALGSNSPLLLMVQSRPASLAGAYPREVASSHGCSVDCPDRSIVSSPLGLLLGCGVATG